MPKLFLPQATLEEWALAEKADIQDGKLVIKEEKSSVPVTPAFHFTQCVSGSDDKKLLSKVKTEAAATALGVEAMGDSALLGETAYEIVTGYLAEVAPAKPPTDPKKKTTAEADMLAEFLLNKL